MPLTFDMSFEQLQTYGGRNPRPEDHDAYWARALAALAAQPDKAEFKPAAQKARGARLDHLYFTGVGGSRVHAKLARPLGAAKGPAVVLFHGYSGDSGDWFDLLSWVGQGFTVASLDCRGQGGWSEDRSSVKGTTMRGHIIRGLDDHPDQLLYRQLFLDTAQLARLVMALPEVDPDRVGASGWSQGGGLTLACAALEPRIRRAAPVYPFLSDYQRVWEMDLAKDAYEELAYFFRTADPEHVREKELFTKLGYIDIQHLAARIRGEVMLTVGLRDTICPPSTQFATYNKITAPKQLVVLPDFGHEHLPRMRDKILTFMLGL